ncbi:PAS domain S-box protein, partial [bacterium]|nr:PAS domain S-box protein [bacterium]
MSRPSPKGQEPSRLNDTTTQPGADSERRSRKHGGSGADTSLDDRFTELPTSDSRTRAASSQSDRLEENAHRYRALSEASFEAIFISEDGYLIEANRAACDMFGYTCDELIGKHSTDLIAPESRKMVREKMLTNDDIPVFEILALRKDGSRFPVETRALMSNYHGRKARVIAMRDITDRLQVEEALRESEERFRGIFETSHAGLVFADDHGRVLLANPAFLELTGYSRDELLQRHFTEITHKDDLDREYALMEGIRTGQQDGYRMEKRYIRKDGTTVWADVSVSPFRNQDGQTQHYVGVVTDITERKRTEQEILTSEHAYRTLAYNLPGIVYRLHLWQEPQIEFFNEMLTALTGYTEEDLFHNKVCSLDPFILDNDRENLRSAIQAALQNGRSYQADYRFRHKDGSIRHFREIGRPVFGEPDRAPFIDGVIFDETSRQTAEAERKRLFTAIEQTHDMIVITDQDGTILYV